MLKTCGGLEKVGPGASNPDSVGMGRQRKSGLIGSEVGDCDVIGLEKRDSLFPYSTFAQAAFVCTIIGYSKIVVSCLCSF